MKWLDSLSFPFLLLLAIWMALAPFYPKPHLVEKIQMLFAGSLRRPLDIFDLFLHAAPLILLAMKVLRSWAFFIKS